MMNIEGPYFNRELSWLSFNHRVLQEAGDKKAPLMERLRFLAIFSSNLEEFFKVRVASLRSLKELKKKERKGLYGKLNRVLKQILKEVVAQQEQFGKIYREQLIPELKNLGILLVNDETVPPFILTKVRKFFAKKIIPNVHPIVFNRTDELFLKHRSIYLVLEFETGKKNSDRYGLLDIPVDKIARFHSFRKNGKYYVLYLDDIVRLFCRELFPGREPIGSFAISISRDAELYLEDEFSGDMLEKIKKSLGKRSTGLPARMLYDAKMPNTMLTMLKDKFGLKDGQAVEGYRYHHFSDFFGFPNPKNVIPEFEKLPLVPVGELSKGTSLFSQIDIKDQMLYFPYQSYEPVIRFLEEAAEDPDVSEIRITLYRVASDSRITQALMKALRNGKKMFVFIEVKARFDEDLNIKQAEQLAQAGAVVKCDMQGLKVHSKLCAITKKIDGTDRSYVYLSTGNFNEKTSRIYTDLGLFTSNQAIADDVQKVFKQLESGKIDQIFQHLLVAPNYLRNQLNELIDKQIRIAEKGMSASIIMKMNSLEDRGMIDKLYEASNAGVTIDLIIRGICCLIPQVKGMSENIRVTSIVGRYLEHSRVFIFSSNGQTKVYVGSADLMSRNLNNRIEVIFPIIHPKLKKEIRTMIDLQLADNTKARIIDAKQKNRFKEQVGEPVNSQLAIQKFLMSARPEVPTEQTIT